jgi:hypothetical protein
VRRIPVDVLALVAIAAFVAVTHLPYVRHGMCFDDPSWYFHFGRRVLSGAVPYRDFVFQVGPLPIYVDAGFQAVFGSSYAASYLAAMFITIVRVQLVWMVVRRLVGWRAAAGLALCCALVPHFAVAHHWSTAYAQLFLTASALGFVLAVRAEGRRALAYLALAGASAALVVSARQSAATLITLMLAATSGILLVRREYFTRTRFLALWGGYAAGLVLVFGALAALGALGPAVQQMFLDAPEKKNIHGLPAVLDAISGGALVDPSFRHWWTGFLYWLGLPTAIVIALGLGLRRDRQVPLSSVLLLVVPGGIVFALATQYGSLNLLSDLPRMVLTATTIAALVWPDRLRAYLGLEPVLAIGLGALPLASDWALEMSFPGRGWGDMTSLMTGALLLSLASPRLAVRVRTVVCGLLGAIGVIHMIVFVRLHVNPFAQADSGDGTLHDNRFGMREPLLARVKISQPRKEALAWLQARVTPGATCFIYGNVPVLYDLLHCTNPTKLDTTAADFITADDANAAAAILQMNPPEFLIAHEQAWMNLPLSLDLGGDPARYDGLNPRASFAMHIGLRAILGRYESLGTVGDAIGSELAKQIGMQRDHVDAIRVYRLRR